MESSTNQGAAITRHHAFSLALVLLAATGLGGTRALAADTDAEFVKSATSGGMMEVDLGRRASQHATSPSVRAFGQRMVSDHGKANAELSAVAKRQGLAVPTEMSEDHREMVEEMAEMRGSDFDEAYMKMMVDDHEHDVEAFREQSKESNSDVDRWAAKILPTLETHLAQARSVNTALQASGAASGNREQDDAEDMPGPAATNEPARP